MESFKASTGLAPVRENIIIVICSAKSAYNTSIKFVSDAQHDIYVISRVPTFLPYLRELFARLAEVPKVRVLLVNEDHNLLVEVLRILLERSSHRGISERKQEFSTKYKSILLNVSDSRMGARSDFHVNLPAGVADLPLGFELMIIQNSDEIDETNYLSEPKVLSQQLLRLVALKHGVRFGALSGFSKLIDDSAAIVTTTNQLFSDSLSEELVIYKPEGLPMAGPVLIHQYVAQGWDSWTKIALVAKSIPHFSKMARLLSTDVQIGDFNDTYDDYFQSVVDSAHIYATPNDTQTAAKIKESGSVSKEQRPEEKQVFDEHDETLQATKRQLAQYLTVETDSYQPLEKPDSSYTYQQFLKELRDRELD